jgi:hypothetical protein
MFLNKLCYCQRHNLTMLLEVTTLEPSFSRAFGGEASAALRAAGAMTAGTGTAGTGTAGMPAGVPAGAMREKKATWLKAGAVGRALKRAGLGGYLVYEP